jgi:hypothetical protein
VCEREKEKEGRREERKEGRMKRADCRNQKVLLVSWVVGHHSLSLSAPA